MAPNQRSAAAATSDINRRLRIERNHKRQVVFTILAIVAVVGWLYVIFESDAFIINDIQVTGTKNLDPMDIKREVFDVLDQKQGNWFIPARHAWFINRDQLQNELMSRLFVNSVTVDKSYGNVLRLSVEERSKRFVFHSHKQYFWVDITGVATDALTDDEARDVQARLLGTRPVRPDEPPVIKRDLDDTINAGFTVTDPGQAKEWIKLADQVKASNLAYREIEPPTVSSTLMKVLSPEGYNVLMDITAPIDLQVRTYQAFIQNKPKDVGNPQYIDVRVPGRVYLK
ncbi:MAG TPA: FtsQ-type POTRA domain-containing protein [Verrucomicrobiae bacterium]|nr:FtsQ-type POTRA domain-containing protein [Verrucomicrobiae bacterium]